MAKLKAATRNKLPSSAFGLPKQRKYPMEDRAHQIKAEEFATKEEHVGKLSPAQAARIRAKTNRLLGANVLPPRADIRDCTQPQHSW